MTQPQPALTLAIPVIGPEEWRPLGESLAGIAEVWESALDDVCVLIQSAKGTPSDFPDDLAPAGLRIDLHCEPDHGIYDAMNRMLERCSTLRILFLGAGDRPLPGLRKAAERWSKDEVEHLELGGVLLPHAEPGVPKRYPARWDRSLYWRNTAHHQGIAYPTSLLRDRGGFSTDYRVLSDYSLNLALYQSGVTAQWASGENWVSVKAGGVSRQFNAELYAEERRMKQAVLRPGVARLCQPLWIRLKAARKRWAQRIR